MDYNHNDEHWDWQRNSHHTPKVPSYDMPECQWNGVPQNEEDLSYMLDDDETTPVKACGDVAYQVNHRDSRAKEPEECRESFSQLKRRRMLQFDTEAIDPNLSCNELSSTFLHSNETADSIEEALSEASQWVSGFSENASASGYDCLGQSPDEWIAECFNDTDMHFSPDDLNFSGASDVQFDITKLCDIQPAHEANVIQQRVTRTPRNNVIFKGRKSYIRTPTKLATSVAYPFAFIKPSGAHGDVTLKDINQRILTPPPSKSKQKQDDPPYPTSAFSGKPVVGKTKIRTEGGKGSITIMRTKG